MGNVRAGIFVSLAAGFMLFGAVAAPVAVAHDPTAGGSNGSLSSGQVIVYKFGTGIPTWVKGPWEDSLEARWSSLAWNNSNAPTFSGPSSSGTAQMLYSDQSNSPCSNNNTSWIQCATGGGTTALKIYVRDFDAAPKLNWIWWDKAQSCTTSNCWFLRRALIHEIGHAVLSLGHDEQGRFETIMASLSPEYTDPGGQREVLQRCDKARAQLLWDLLDKYEAYADCFDHITNSGSTGLKTVVTSSGTSFLACNGDTISVSGRA